MHALALGPELAHPVRNEEVSTSLQVSYLGLSACGSALCRSLALILELGRVRARVFNFERISPSAIAFKTSKRREETWRPLSRWKFSFVDLRWRSMMLLRKRPRYFIRRARELANGTPTAALVLGEP